MTLLVVAGRNVVKMHSTRQKRCLANMLHKLRNVYASPRVPTRCVKLVVHTDIEVSIQPQWKPSIYNTLIHIQSDSSLQMVLNRGHFLDRFADQGSMCYRPPAIAKYLLYKVAQHALNCDAHK